MLGSGLNELADRLADADGRPLRSDSPFPAHDGRRACRARCSSASSAACRVIVFQGRFHYYEGHDLETVTFPVRVLQKLGVSTLDPDRGHRRHPRRPARRATWCS